MQALIDFDGWRKWKDFSSAGLPAAAKTSTTAGPAVNGEAKPLPDSKATTNGDAALPVGPGGDDLAAKVAAKKAKKERENKRSSINSLDAVAESNRTQALEQESAGFIGEA